jgi:hypothetical protein
MKLKVATIVAVLAAVGLYMTGPLHAQLPIPASSQFDMTGFLQEASVDSPADAHSGGKLKVNGHIVIVPRETIVILPATALSWQELFSQAPAPYTGVATGMAMADVPAPLTTYEVQVVGNRVLGGAGGADVYIAGLIYVSQQGLNSGAGYINFIDYTVGEMRVGGVIGDSTTGARVRLNDPVGRYGRVMSPDVRFTVDADNPTITAGTGFPMCLPRVAPPALGGAETDAQCPQANRPIAAVGPPVVYQGQILMQAPVGGAAATTPYPNPFLQAPLEVGDYVSYAGTLIQDNAFATAKTYIAAHTLEDNVSIITAAGTNPAYVRTDVYILGTGGLTVLGAGEAVVRTRFEGFTTDISRNVHLYGIDIDPLTGATSERDWGTIGVDQGAPNGAVMGRWRFRPPCLAQVATDKACTPPPGGVFLPAPREMRAVIEGLQGQVTALNANDQTKTAANGIFYGQYHAPILEYIFPENVPGTPIVENNFQSMPFLAQGGYASALGTMAGQLFPWPGSSVPAAACTGAVALAGGPYSVPSGGTVTLSGSATGTAPVSFSWAAPAQGTLSSLTIAGPVYTAPIVAAQTVVALSLTATNSCGTSVSNATVTINAPLAPTVNPVSPISVFSGNVGSFSVTGSGAGQLTFAVAQAGAPALLNLRVSRTGLTSALVQFTAPTLPAGQTVPSVINLSITASNVGGGVSAATGTTVTIKPIADQVTIQTTEYRIGKQRLILTATSSNPAAILSLNPYVTTSGATFNPAVLGNVFAVVAGVPTLTLVGAPEPACNPGGAFATPCSASPLTVSSNFGGVSPAIGLQKIRN